LTGRTLTPGPAAEVVSWSTTSTTPTPRRRLAQRGAVIISGPADRPWGHRAVHLVDPEEFIVEFAQEIPRQTSRRPRV
jgi:lactoylglutathione lyase